MDYLEIEEIIESSVVKIIAWDWLEFKKSKEFTESTWFFVNIWDRNFVMVTKHSIKDAKIVRLKRSEKCVIDIFMDDFNQSLDLDLAFSEVECLNDKCLPSLWVGIPLDKSQCDAHKTISYDLNWRSVELSCKFDWVVKDDLKMIEWITFLWYPQSVDIEIGESLRRKGYVARFVSKGE